MSIKAFAYIGVPSEKRISQLDIQEQINCIRKAAIEHEVEIIDWFIERDHCGGEIFNMMISRLNETDAVIIGDMVGDFTINIKLTFMVYNAGKRLCIIGLPKFFVDDDDAILYFRNISMMTNKKEIREKQMHGIKEYKRRNGRWGRRKKRIEWKQYEKYKSMNLPWSNIAKLLDVSVVTLKRRVAEREEEINNNRRKQEQ